MKPRSDDAVKDSVDIVEAGTILCLNEGLGAVKALREQCPDKIIVADWKVADAKVKRSRNRHLAPGANWTQSSAPRRSPRWKKATRWHRNCGGEIQIELFGNWTLDDARDWHRIGVRQAIYHRGRDAQASGQQWGDRSARMKALSDIGLELSITGGITLLTCRCLKIRVKRLLPDGRWQAQQIRHKWLAISMRKSTPSGEASVRNHPLGIYEKALAKDLSGPERLVLAKLWL